MFKGKDGKYWINDSSHHVGLSNPGYDGMHHLDFWLISKIDENVYNIIEEVCKRNNYKIKKMTGQSNKYNDFEIYKRKIFRKKETFMIIDHFQVLGFKIPVKKADEVFKKNGLADDLVKNLSGIIITQSFKFIP